MRIEGSKGGYFEIGWLEGRRTQRQIYRVQWAEVPYGAKGGGRLLLVGRYQQESSPLSSPAELLPAPSQAVVSVGLGGSSTCAPLAALHSALSLLTASGARVWLLTRLRRRPWCWQLFWPTRVMRRRRVEATAAVGFVISLRIAVRNDDL